MPVPELEQTMSEYLRLLEPVLTQPEHDKTKNIVKQFMANLGPSLQKYLVDKQTAEANWVSFHRFNISFDKHFFFYLNI